MKISFSSAKGLGDALLMMIGATQALRACHDVSFIHPQAERIAPLFREGIDIREDLPDSDLLFVQNDNSERAWHYLNNREKHVRIIHLKKGKGWQKGDILLNPKQPMGVALAHAMCQEIGATYSLDNWIKLPMIRKEPLRLAIHPMSGNLKKNWSPAQFIELAERLKRDYKIAFIVSPNEREEWQFVQEIGYDLPNLLTYVDLRDYLAKCPFFIGNDSGPGHLAARLGAKTLTLFGNPKLAKQWRPIWGPNVTLKPNFPLPNFKGIGFPYRDENWTKFVSVSRTERRFRKLCRQQ